MVNEAECRTDPDMVADFVERTGCDTLAVSVGNVHGLCLDPRIDIPLLAKINRSLRSSACASRRLRHSEGSNLGRLRNTDSSKLITAPI